jgi:hypothetical protein
MKSPCEVNLSDLMSEEVSGEARGEMSPNLFKSRF